MSFYLVFIHGPAASGKHTVGCLVSEQLSLPLFHNHLTVDLVKTFFDFGTKPFSELRAIIWKNTFRVASEARRSFVFTFNPEKTVDPALIEELTDCVKAAGGAVHYVELLCSDEEIVRRIGNKSRRAFGKLTDASVYQSFKEEGGFDFPPFPEAIARIDTEKLGPQEAAKAIVEAVKAAS